MFRGVIVMVTIYGKLAIRCLDGSKGRGQDGISCFIRCDGILVQVTSKDDNISPGCIDLFCDFNHSLFIDKKPIVQIREITDPQIIQGFRYLFICDCFLSDIESIRGKP